MDEITEDGSLLEQAASEEVVESSEVVSEEAPKEETAEDKARAKGWKPQSEYTGENEWVDAETYLRNGSYLREINKLKKIITNLSDTLSKSEERAYSKALKDLETKRAEAELTSDIAKYKEVEAEAKELQKQFNVTSESKPSNPNESAEVKVWLAQNPWFTAPKTEEDFDKAALAKSASTYFAKNNPGASIAEELAYVSSKLNAKFGTQKDEVSAKAKVLSPGNKTSAASGNTEFKGLSNAQKTVVEYLKRTGQDYTNYLKAAKSQNKDK